MRLAVASISCIGSRAGNEDACGWTDSSGLACFVLSDGAGGHGAGDVASRLAVSTVLESFAAWPSIDPRNVAALVDRAHAAVLAGQAKGGEQSDMRATLVVLAIDVNTGRATWSHVGDSRLYAIRAGKVAAVTRDHSFLQAMLDAGFVSDADAPGAPSRNMLTASLGSEDACEPDTVTEPFVCGPGDAFLLCSDGLWDRMTDATLASSANVDVEDWLRHLQGLVERAAAADQDNYSAIAVRCLD